MDVKKISVNIRNKKYNNKVKVKLKLYFLFLIFTLIWRCCQNFREYGKNSKVSRVSREN